MTGAFSFIGAKTSEAPALDSHPDLAATSIARADRQVTRLGMPHKFLNGHSML